MTKTHMNKIKDDKRWQGEKLPIRNDGNHRRNSEGIKKNKLETPKGATRLIGFFCEGKEWWKLHQAIVGA